jgi:hypothetical protein
MFRLTLAIVSDLDASPSRLYSESHLIGLDKADRMGSGEYGSVWSVLTSDARMRKTQDSFDCGVNLIKKDNAESVLFLFVVKCAFL